MDIAVAILDIIHRPVFYLKQNVSETSFCRRLQVEPTELDPVETSSIYRAQLSKFHLKTEIQSSRRNVALNKRQIDG
jgi:hypothetical protein